MRSLLRKSWSLRFICDHLPYMTLASALRYRGLILRQGGQRAPRVGVVPLRLKGAIAGKVWLREPGTDCWTFTEVAIRQIYKRVTERILDCRYVLDLGGNIGLTSLFFAARFPKCQIAIVEPDKGNYELLQRNLAGLLACGRCQSFHGAAWSENVPVVVSAPPEGTGFDAIQVSSASPGREAVFVQGYTISSLLELAHFPHVDILKIDVEGAEVELFRGDLAWLSKVNAITIEFHADSRQTTDFDRIMRDHGFVVEEDVSPNTVLAWQYVQPLKGPARGPESQDKLHCAQCTPSSQREHPYSH
jgi:FkbM family methyltransferase